MTGNLEEGLMVCQESVLSNAKSAVCRRQGTIMPRFQTVSCSKYLLSLFPKQLCFKHLVLGNRVSPTQYPLSAVDRGLQDITQNGSKDDQARTFQVQMFFVCCWEQTSRTNSIGYMRCWRHRDESQYICLPTNPCPSVIPVKVNRNI